MSRCMRWLSLVVAAGLLGGCEAGDGDVPSVMDVRMVGVSATQMMTGVSADPLEGARIVRLTVEGPGMEPVSLAYDFLSNNGGALPAFPEGYDRQVTVELCAQRCDESVAGDIVSRGRSVPLTRFKGDSSRNVNVFVAPRNAFVTPVSLADDGVTWEASTLARKERLGATVTTLDDGRLLIVGGSKKKADARTWFLASDIGSLYGDAEIYDPRTGEFTAAGGALAVPRAFHQAIKLGGPNKKDGRVLILGGFTNESGSIKPSSSVEIYDPTTDRFEAVSAGLLGGGRALFTASLAYPDDGVILIVGGLADPGVVGGTWHLYKVGTGTIAAGPLMDSTDGKTGKIRYNHTMTYLDNYGFGGTSDGAPGYVLIGGENSAGTIGTTEAYLPEAGRFNVVRDDTSLPELPVGGRTLHASVHVPSLGLVYVIGGFLGRDLADPTNRIEVYWIGQKNFQGETGMFLGSARGGLTATLMDASTILVAGGYGGSGPTADTDVLVVNKECWQAGDPPQEQCGRVPRAFYGKTPAMDAARAGHIGVFDPTRRLLLTGGFGEGNVVPDPILYNPD